MGIEPTGDLKMEHVDDTTFRYVAPIHRYRFLLSTGVVIDVLADRDSSTIRGALLAQYPKDTNIEGVADLGVHNENP